MEEIRYRPIGTIHSPYQEPAGTPIQPSGARGVEGTVEVQPPYVGGLRDLEGFSHIILLYHFHRAGAVSLEVTPYLDRQPHGLFATRAPARPNPIGLSVVRLERIEGGTLYIRDVDVVDGTPLLDIKPFVPAFDVGEVTRVGWLERHVHKLSQAQDDGRFAG